ncbi:MAG: plasmid pRiA4b ORF-3 family protein [Desulfobacteraceae bacterium]|nr:plasmid pRiA4b ORF-3 family protein [Desulfobacteraceae bacterium]
MQDKFNAIAEITDEFSKKHLNEEYAQFIRYAIAALCRKRPSPLAKGKDKTWACGITHAIGMVNFLYDPSQVPHISAKELYKCFGVSVSTGAAKSKTVRDALKMYQLDPDWCLPSMIDNNPMAWMISVDGFTIDARHAPKDIQKQAYEKGLIPYLPGSEDDVEKITIIPKKKKAVSSSKNSLYTMEIFIVGGPVSEKFIKKNPVISRTIEIRGNQTLEDLHDIIFDAFDRFEPHMYEFQVGGKRPNDPEARRYVTPEDSDSSDADGEVSKTTIASLGLAVDEVFGYWFDFGDDWWHQINVISVKDKIPKGKYPKIIKEVGDSPPQYDDEY